MTDTVRIISIGHKLHGYRKHLGIEATIQHNGKLVTSYHYDIPESSVADAVAKGGLHQGEADKRLGEMKEEERRRRGV